MHNSDNFYNSVDDLPLFLSVQDLMLLLGVGRNTVYGLLKRGDIHSVRVGAQLRVPKESLIEFLKSQT